MNETADHGGETKRFLTRRKLLVTIIVGLVAYAGVDLGLKYLSLNADRQTIREIVASEELILELTPRLGDLSRSALNLKLPDRSCHELFENQVITRDLDATAQPAPDGDASDGRMRKMVWPTQSQDREGELEQLQMWRSLFLQVDFFEHAKFYFIRGEFTGDDLDEFDSDIGFKGLARTSSGQWRSVKAKQHVLWRRQASNPESGGEDAEKATWRISRWRLESLETTDSGRILFAEILNHALPRDEDLLRARNSTHEQQVIEFYRKGGNRIPTPYFAPISANLKPGLSVVDIDKDGWDDLYVTVRAGRNQLLRNRGDGTFEEIASDLGLDIRGDTTCAIFADFDNDGDTDAMLGRSLQRSLFLENVRGRFVRRRFVLGTDSMPYLVTSMSAADYNGDGLLDVYLSTYRPAAFQDITARGRSDKSGNKSKPNKWLDEFLPEKQAREYRRRAESTGTEIADETSDSDEIAGADAGRYNDILNQVGPPNILLVNRGGGRFEISPHGKQLHLWRNTLQATWSDFDEDGDPDLYVANDWAPDNLFRNDGAEGFVDITQAAGTTEFGFAMGASWGDYDNDGRMDLYVSNMYSKAGRRITAQIAELKPDFARSVEGNYLYRGRGDSFDLVSGLKPPALTVAEAGWSWGGQFVDVDNDGYLDIYVLSGYFTAPKQFASQVDL